MGLEESVRTDENFPLDQDHTLPGWVCAAIGVGFVALLALAIILVRVLGS